MPVHDSMRARPRVTTRRTQKFNVWTFIKNHYSAWNLSVINFSGSNHKYAESRMAYFQGLVKFVLSWSLAKLRRKSKLKKGEMGESGLGLRVWSILGWNLVNWCLVQHLKFGFWAFLVWTRPRWLVQAWRLRHNCSLIAERSQGESVFFLSKNIESETLNRFTKKHD